MGNLWKNDIRVGTIVRSNGDTAGYIREILPHGFESLSLTFWETTDNVDFERLAGEVRDAIEGSDAVISSLAVYGNPLENNQRDQETLKSWERLIDSARLFGCDIVAGFTGRVRGKPIDDTLPAFKKVFTPLAAKAGDKGVRIAFENCAMRGNWQSGDSNIAHNPTAWKMMFDALPFENVGLQWEPCHQMVALIDPIAQLREWVGKIIHVHGKDATVMWDVIRQHGILGPQPFAFHRTPGYGDCNWVEVISELRRGGFTGSIDIEGWHDPVMKGELEMTGQVRALNYLKECRGEHVSNPRL